MVKIVRDSHLRRYFPKIGTSKLQTRNASDATKSIPSIESNDGSVHTPITEFGSSSLWVSVNILHVILDMFMR
jgi:hypothetical protein